MPVRLTEGVVEQMKEGACVKDAVMQVRALKALLSGNVTRYRAFLSDGKDCILTSFTSQEINDKISRGWIDSGSIVTLTAYDVDEVRSSSSVKRYELSVDDLDIQSKGVSHDMIGDVVVPPFEAPVKMGMSGTDAMARPSSIALGTKRPGAKTASAAPAAPKAPPKKMSFADLTELSKNYVVRAKMYTIEPERSWNNAKGSGTLKAHIIQDEAGDLMKLTLFKGAIDKYKYVQEDKWYDISGAVIKPGNAKFRPGNIEYEMSDSNGMTIKAVSEDTVAAMETDEQFDFTPLEALGDLDDKAVVNVLVIVNSVGAIEKKKSTFKEKDGRERVSEYDQRVISVIDAKGLGVELTVRAESARRLDETYLADHPVLHAKNVVRSTWNSISLTGKSGVSKFIVNPSGEDARKLAEWFKSADVNAIHSLTEAKSSRPQSAYDPAVTRIFIRDLVTQTPKEKGSYFSFVGMMAKINHETDKLPWYDSCSQTGCKKKVEEQEDGYYCAGCDVKMDKCIPRHKLSTIIMDATSSHWFGAFDEAGIKLLDGTTAEECKQLLQDGEEDKFNKVYEKPLYRKKVFLASVTLNRKGGNDDPAAQLNIESVEDIDVAKELEILKGLIETA